jgi:phosphoribosylformimino-5-aminoimidazole carboxamide ribotide isomerase
MDSIQIREAPIKEVWQLRHSVMYPEETPEFVKLDDDDNGLHFGLYIENNLVAVISVFERDNGIQFRKFATDVSMQGRGYGTRLLEFIMNWAVSHNKKSIWCNARRTATTMYQKFGMQPVGPGWKKYGIEFIKMEKQLT